MNTTRARLGFLRQPVTGLALGALGLSLALLAACSADTEETPTATAAPTESSSAGGTVLSDAETDLATANARRTGQAEIDTVLNALFGGDQGALDALVLSQTAVCHAESLGLGDVEVCPEGVPDGTEVEFFTTADCEGYPLHQRPFVTPLDPTSDRLVAVVAVEPRDREPIQYWPDGDYLVIVLPDPTSTEAWGIVIDDGMIVRTQTGCATVETLFEAGGAAATDLLAVAS